MRATPLPQFASECNNLRCPFWGTLKYSVPLRVRATIGSVLRAGEYSFRRKQHDYKPMTLDSLGVHRKLWHMTALLLLLLAFLLVDGSLSLPARSLQSVQHKPGKPKEDAVRAAKDLPVPFRIPETLNYRVTWAAFTNAASLQLSVIERRNLFGWRTWHFRASAHTLNPMRTLFAVDDQFDSYTDSGSLESRQYELYLNEMGRNQNKVLHFLPMGQVPRTPGSAVVVPQGTLDPLGAIYSLRGADWQRTPEIRAPVCDGHDVYEMRAKMESPNEPLTTDAGKFTASRVLVSIFQKGKEVEGIKFSVWLAHDGPRTPVLMQAELPFGSIRIELTSASQ